ncbi:ATP-binding cassette domain-containing protein [Pseudoalteromonas sp. MTN2-4]|uniref:ATP-binding cassette domain-containing protein n=1 Tax=Pseudoalteromonas sp. MTN2-4 TaxID=3056555 RepID=UPI0036F3B236
MNLSLRKIHHKLQGRDIFNDLNLEVQSGGCCVIKGVSGSGKSLLFSMICDIVRPQNGCVVYNNVCLPDMDKSQYYSYKKETGAIFQLPALISNLTLKENLLLPLNQFCNDLSYQDKLKIIESKCEEIGLQNQLELRTDHLSIGIASLVGVIRATILQPKVIVWDSPICEVDSHWADYEINLIKNLNSSGVTQILFSNRRVISTLADSVYQLKSGSCYAA